MSELLIPRSRWGARYRAGVGARALPTAELWLHHSATLSPDLVFTDLNADSLDDDEVKAMRQIEAIGQQRFGYGFSYNVAGMPSGRLYEGCGVSRVGSHTGGRNTRAMGFVLVGDYSSRPVPDALRDAVVLFMREGERRRWLDQAKIDGGHRDLKSTACPGDQAYALIPTFNELAANVAFDPVLEDDMSESIGPGSNDNTVKLVQRCLLNEARVNGRPNPLPTYGADGDYGDETKSAVRAYQSLRGIKTAAPGIAGGVTCALLFRFEKL